MPRNTAEYTIEHRESGLEYLTEPPTKDDYQKQLVDILDAPGRYSKHHPSFHGTAEFKEGNLLTFDSAAEDAKSAHSFTPKERVLTEVLEEAANHAKFFNDQERSDFALAITELATAEQTQQLKNHSEFTPAERDTSLQEFHEYQQKVHQMVAGALDTQNLFHPYSVSKDIMALTSGDYGHVDHDPVERHDLHTFDDKAMRYHSADQSYREHLVNIHLTLLMGQQWQQDTPFYTSTRRSIMDLYHQSMSDALQDNNEKQYNSISTTVEKVAQMASYAPDRSTFLTHHLTDHTSHLSIDEEHSAQYQAGGETWLYMNDRVEQIADPDIKEVAHHLFIQAQSLDFHEDNTAYMHDYVALAEYLDAYDIMKGTQESYAPQSDLEPDAHFTRLNVSADYVYRHAFHSPGDETSEAERIVLDAIANHILPELRHAQHVGDAQQFHDAMEYAKTADDAADLLQLSDLDYYSRGDAPHDDPDNHNQTYVIERLQHNIQLANSLNDDLPDHLLNQVVHDVHANALYHASCLVMYQTPRDDENEHRRAERYEQTIFRLMVAERALENLRDLHAVNE